MRKIDISSAMTGKKWYCDNRTIVCTKLYRTHDRNVYSFLFEIKYRIGVKMEKEEILKF